MKIALFSVFTTFSLRTHNSKKAFVHWSIRLSVCPSIIEHESRSMKTRIFAPAHPSATGVGRVSGLVPL